MAERKIPAESIQGTLSVKCRFQILIAIILCYAGFTGAFTGWGWLVWLCPPLLAAATLHSRSISTALVFACFSTFSWGSITSWLPLGINSMNPNYPVFGYLTLLVLALLSAIPYLVFGLFCGHQGWLSRRNPHPLAAAALLSLLVELWPARLPGTLGHALYRSTTFIQLVDIGGTGLLSFIVYGSGFLLIKLGLIDKHADQRLKSSLVLASILASTLLYGTLRLETWAQYLAHTQPIMIAVVQPNLPLEHLETPASAGNSLQTLLNQTSTVLHNHPSLDLVVWPEIPIFFSPANILANESDLTNLLQDSPVALLANADRYTNDLVYGRVPFFNTVQLFRGSGQIEQEYRKMILVPFGEYLPFESWLTSPDLKYVLSDLRRYLPGEKIVLIDLKPGVKVGTPVCLEAHHTEHVGAMVRQGANMLVNPANDAYFGTSPGAQIDLALTVFRAVEYRIPLLRVTNSGISALIDQRGVIDPDSLIPAFTAESRIVEVSPSSEAGYLLPQTCGMLFMVALVAVAFSKRIREQSDC